MSGLVRFYINLTFAKASKRKKTLDYEHVCWFKKKSLCIQQ